MLCMLCVCYARHSVDVRQSSVCQLLFHGIMETAHYDSLSEKWPRIMAQSFHFFSINGGFYDWGVVKAGVQ